LLLDPLLDRLPFASDNCSALEAAPGSPGTFPVRIGLN
jgi:hypothetical protein